MTVYGVGKVTYNISNVHMSLLHLTGGSYLTVFCCSTHTAYYLWNLIQLICCRITSLFC